MAKPMYFNKISFRHGLVCLLPGFLLPHAISRQYSYITIPYSNLSQSIKDAMLSSFSTSIPTKSAKSLTPLLEGEGGLAKGQ